MNAGSFKTKTKTATQKSKGASHRSPEVQYLSLPTCRSQTRFQYQILFTTPSRFTDSELVVPQPIEKNAVDRPGHATPPDTFLSQYPKFHFNLQNLPFPNSNTTARRTRRMPATNSILRLRRLAIYVGHGPFLMWCHSLKSIFSFH